ARPTALVAPVPAPLRPPFPVPVHMSYAGRGTCHPRSPVSRPAPRRVTAVGRAGPVLGRHSPSGSAAPTARPPGFHPVPVTAAPGATASVRRRRRRTPHGPRRHAVPTTSRARVPTEQGTTMASTSTKDAAGATAGGGTFFGHPR